VQVLSVARICGKLSLGRVFKKQNKAFAGFVIGLLNLATKAPTNQRVLIFSKISKMSLFLTLNVKKGYKLAVLIRVFEHFIYN
jgi:hypothetical protein